MMIHLQIIIIIIESQLSAIYLCPYENTFYQSNDANAIVTVKEDLTVDICYCCAILLLIVN